MEIRVDDAADARRQRLVEISEETRALPSDAFARRYELQTEADSIRRELADLVSDDLRRAKSEWTERSARKGAHAGLDPSEAAAGIVSPGEGGGGAG